MNKIVADIEKKANDWQKPICYSIRECILDFIPQVEESIKWLLPFYHIGKGNICFINIRKEDIKVGFYWGAKFSAQELLEGDGVQVRHLVYRKGDVFDAAILKVLLEEALEWTISSL
ncbi:MAG: DUF1801 domain-containing protein [Flavobacteriales bacterium]|nr:DUF1801 domain-containing protein [Flavobacteriales bacterium]